MRVPVTMLLEVASIEIESHPPYRFFATTDEALRWLDQQPREAS